VSDRPAVLVVGAGTVGARTTRELLGVGGDGRSAVRAGSLAGRRPGRLERLTASFGSSVAMVDVSERPIDFSSADVVVVTRAAGDQLEVARSALAAGCHVVCTTDDLDEVRELLALDDLARSAGRTVVAGAAMAPGLSCLLARHAASLLDEVDEIHVARAGAGGPSCARQRRRALRGSAIEWRDGEWARRPGFSGRELVWFPDPTGGSDCYRAELADPVLLVDAFPGLVRASARMAASRIDRVTVPLPMLIGPPIEGAPGAIRVEVRGTRGGERHDVVYGAFDRPSVATAAVAAVVAVALASGGSEFDPGAGGLARVREARPLLRELARRGVRAAVFEGSRDFGVAEDLDGQIG
jgi:hypothetical protein